VRISGTTYNCDECHKEEREKSSLLNWLTVGILRDEIAPVRGGTLWRRDFCSPDCLIEWLRSQSGYSQISEVANDTKT